MAKTKISEFSATPGNNTDIDGINIAEGCAPSGINDAIRELMAQLKDWQAGTSNDPYVVGSSGSLTLSYGTANGVPYLNGSKVVTSGSALTFDGTNFATTGSVTSAGSSNSGNLTFTGTGNRITGDFTNATIASRVLFQTSTSNSGTFVGAIGNGTVADYTGSGYVVWANSDTTNSNTASLVAFKNLEARISSGAVGAASFVPMTFYTGGSERMRVDTSGNVGIGTSSPVSQLHLVSSADSGLTIYKSAVGAGNVRVVSQGGGSALAFGSDQATGTTERMRIDSSGNVGIGTSSPAVPLDVNGRIRTRGSSNFLDLYHTGSIAYVETTGGTNTPLAFATTGLERARIDTSGNLLVGTTSAAADAVGARLLASNQIQASKSSDWSFRMGRTTSSGIIAEIYYNTSRVGDIATNGSNTTYNSASDYRLKENIVPMTGALEKILTLNPVTYNWKVDGSNGQGFIAHELQEVVPDAVRGVKDEIDENGNPVYQGIDTSFLVATLTAAIQELKAINDAQAETITALTARVTALESN